MLRNEDVQAILRESRHEGRSTAKAMADFRRRLGLLRIEPIDMLAAMTAHLAGKPHRGRKYAAITIWPAYARITGRGWMGPGEDWAAVAVDPDWRTKWTGTVSV